MTTQIRITILAMFTAFAATGCCFMPSTGNGSPEDDPALAAAPGSPSRASCDVSATLSSCRDMGPAAFALGEDLQRSLCTGIYTSGGTCPTENRVGSCEEGGGMIRRYYSSGPLPYTAESARADCQTMTSATFLP